MSEHGLVFNEEKINEHEKKNGRSVFCEQYIAIFL